MSAEARNGRSAASLPLAWLKLVFVRLGVLPFLLIAALVVFSAMSDKFLTGSNLMSVVRQSTYLIIVSLGQMLALLTGGFDLSVGVIMALTSVVGALAMVAVYGALPDMGWLAMLAGASAGIAAGTMVGVVNGVGVALFKVSPFIMTLGVASIGFGFALDQTSGTPVYGMPQDFGEIFYYATWLDVPIPVYAALLAALALALVLYRMPLGRYFYAIGGNIKAAKLSGIQTGKVLFLTYVLCALMASIAGMLLTARMDTGEANIGASMPLESIAACVIAGVSLRGGIGRLENVVLGALFINLVQNGMNLARINSYLQMEVLGVLLILAVAVDQLRLRFMATLKD
jgi:ribose transport system permease protein